MYYFNVFFFFSIIGHFLETILFLVIKSKRKSGFLYLWWTPFYGLGAILSWLVYKSIDKKILNKKKKIILLFIIYFLLFSVFEYCGGMLLEHFYGRSFWNYSKIPLHIGKYVSVWTSLIWVMFSFIYIYFIKQYTDKLIKYIPKSITYVLIFVFVLDVIFSLLKVL